LSPSGVAAALHNTADSSQVINIDFCGDGITGSSWKKDSRCYSQEFPTCRKYVAANPDAYREAYWLFNSIKLYHKTVTDS